MKNNAHFKNEIVPKVYRSPHLTIYGHITELTHNAAATGPTPDDNNRGTTKYS
jgi:hypothetical protein